jgi:protein-tyrosine-phosphatase
MVELRNILFLCTANSARSILAEAITNRIGRGRVRAFSAGSHPSGRVNPEAIQLLIDLGYETANLRSKSWQEFTAPGAPVMDLVITLCDEAAGESCPVWPGAPLTAHWGVRDPAAEKTPRAVRAALADAHRIIEGRVHRLLDLPFSALDQAELRHFLRDIGEDRLLIQAFTL